MKKQYLTIAILLFLLLVLPLLLILVKKRAEIRPKAAFGTVDLALTPPTLTKNVGEEFEVEVQIIQKELAVIPQAGETPTPEVEVTFSPSPIDTPIPTPRWKTCCWYACGTGWHGPVCTHHCVYFWDIDKPCPPDECQTKEDCQEPTPTPKSPTPTRRHQRPTPPPPTPTHRRLPPTPTPTKVAGCNQRCNPTIYPPINCQAGLTCYTGPSPKLGAWGVCRNPNCPEEEDCICEKKATPTPTPSFNLISGADITLAFDKDVLEAVGVSIEDTEFTALVLKEIKNEEGKVRFSAVAKKPTSKLPQGEVIPVVKIAFKGKAPGRATVSFESYQIVGYNEQNEDVTLKVDQKKEGSYTVSGEVSPTPEAGVPRINFAIKFRGMGEKKPDLKIRLRVVDEKQTEEPKHDFEEIEVVSEENRIYRPKEGIPLEGVTPGTDFTLLVKGPKHLQKRMAKRIKLFEGEDERNNFDWQEKPLEPGDLPPQDGVCNAHDASLLLERIGRSDEEALGVADLNYDGVVNLNDYSLLIATLSEKYEDEE